MFSIGVLGMALFAATDSALAYLVKVFLGGAFVDPDPDVLWMVPVGAIVLFTLRGIGDYVSNYFPGWVGRQIIKAMRGELFAHYLGCRRATTTAPPPGRCFPDSPTTSSWSRRRPPTR